MTRAASSSRSLGGAAAAWPVAAHAQQEPIPVVGFLSSTSAAPYKPFVEAIFDGLKAQGYVLGGNLAAEQRWAEGNYDRLPAYADDLVRMRVSVIVAIAPPAARAAKAATSSIPIVFSTSGNPVSLGLVSSLNRPGGNLTGVNFLLFEMVTKRLELLTKLDATADVIGVLVNPNNPSTARSLADAQAAAQTLGKKLVVGIAGARKTSAPPLRASPIRRPARSRSSPILSCSPDGNRSLRRLRSMRCPRSTRTGSTSTSAG